MNTGLHTMTMPEYIALQALSSGVCHKILSQSPLHAWFDSPWNPARADSPNDASDLGTCAHSVLLEGNEDKIAVINPIDYVGKTGGIPKGWTNTAIREARDIARLDGKIPVLPEDMADIRAMVAAAKSYIAGSELAGVFDDGKPEQTIVWSEVAGGGQIVDCKTRPDWLNDKTLLHYKTSTNANPRAFSRLVANMGYDFALAFYMRGLSAALPDAEVDHLILCQEVEAPYACKLFDLSSALAEVAERRVERAIGVWARCLASGKFPAYDGSVHSIELMPWELAQAEEDMLNDQELSGGIPA